ncbi:O-methyltransferase [Xylariaceae sp. FL0804]|nr:O-methyltransferase [Xylariaceae sp. FL0804]
MSPKNGVEKGASTDNGVLRLAARIVQQATSVDDYLRNNNLKKPIDAVSSYEPPETLEYQSLTSTLVSSLEELRDVVEGPRAHMRSLICGGYDLAAFQVAFELDLFSLVPKDGDIEIRELAHKAGADVDRVARVLRMMATHRVFQEKKPGVVSHTAASVLFCQDEDLNAAGHYTLDEMLKAVSSAGDCVKASPFESDSTHSPFNTRFGMPLFPYYKQNPKFAARFAKAMAGATQVDRQITELQNDFRWDQLQGKVVDVGGGSGHISVVLAKAFPSLEFVVQDGSPEMLAQGKNLDLGTAKGRVSWMQHDFFQPQPLRDVGAFFIRQCTHNWSNRDVVMILRAFVPGLEGSRSGTPLLINDTILPEPGTIPVHAERGLRQMDMLMFVCLGAKQRTRAEFEMLLKEADERYIIKGVHSEGTMGLLEVHLRK